MKNVIKLLGIIALIAVVGCGITTCGGGGGGDDDDNIYNVTTGGTSNKSTTQLMFYVHEQIPDFSGNSITLSGVSGVTKGNLSGPTWVTDQLLGSGSWLYTLPISGFTTSGMLTVAVGSSSWEVYISYIPGQEGIYIGIIKFAGDAQALNLNNDYGVGGGYGPGYNNQTNSNALVLLDYQVKSNIQTRLNNDYQIAYQPGTAVYYAVHKALANLKNSESQYPDKIDSVYMITFTDGLDNASSGQSLDYPVENKSFDTTPQYAAYVKNEITSRTIKGKEITAYSIGVRGSDVSDIPGFQSALANIAGPGKSQELTDFDAVQSTFDEIADGLIQGSNFSMSTTLLDSGTKVRMTFDIVDPTSQNAVSSTKYIEGTINRTGSGGTLTYTFNDITYKGISSDAGAGPITGTRSGTTVNFLFSNITGYNYATDNYRTKQWTMAPGASAWQYNSEYQSSKSDFGTTVIYLVLDCSTSMSYENISKIREAVQNFVDKIFNARYQQ